MMEIKASVKTTSSADKTSNGKRLTRPADGDRPVNKTKIGVAPAKRELRRCYRCGRWGRGNEFVQLPYGKTNRSVCDLCMADIEAERNKVREGWTRP